jgi:hypothetical protein
MDDDFKRKILIPVIVSTIITSSSVGRKYIVEGRCPNCSNADYDAIVKKIKILKVNNVTLFTRTYRLTPKSFDKVLTIIYYKLMPKKKTCLYIVPPIIKLCMGLRLLAGGSYLDLSFGYDIPDKSVYKYAWEALDAIDCSLHPFLNNIKSPINSSPEELETLENGFAKLSDYKLRGTVAAGDGVVFKMVMPSNEEVDGDVTSYYTRKGYYAYGLQVILCLFQ